MSVLLNMQYSLRDVERRMAHHLLKGLHLHLIKMVVLQASDYLSNICHKLLQLLLHHLWGDELHANGALIHCVQQLTARILLALHHHLNVSAQLHINKEGQAQPVSTQEVDTWHAI